jgi:hypothetical protein
MCSCAFFIYPYLNAFLFHLLFLQYYFPLLLFLYFLLNYICLGILLPFQYYLFLFYLIYIKWINIPTPISI